MSSRDPLICHLAAQKTLAEDYAQRQAFKPYPEVVKAMVEDTGQTCKALVAMVKERVVQKGTSAHLETDSRPILVMTVPFETGIEAIAKKRAKYTDVMTDSCWDMDPDKRALLQLRTPVTISFLEGRTAQLSTYTASHSTRQEASIMHQG